ncbi:hypothetical protein BHM03_00051634 [Ensete ventricosum]|nr:hypothetical protein BHM03_00051634 [Ensete ventricosum]
MTAATLPPTTGGRELSEPPSDGISNLRFSNHTDLLLVSSWDKVNNSLNIHATNTGNLTLCHWGLVFSSLSSPVLSLPDPLLLRVFVCTMPGRTFSRGSSCMLAPPSMIQQGSTPVPIIQLEGACKQSLQWWAVSIDGCQVPIKVDAGIADWSALTSYFRYVFGSGKEDILECHDAPVRCVECSHEAGRFHTLSCHC